MTDQVNAIATPVAPVASNATEPAFFKPVTQPELFNLLNLIRPWQMISDTKIRLGSDADGGYVMPSSSLRSNTVISIGIGNEVSFDNELARLGDEVTVKRFQRNKHLIELHAENPDFRTIVVQPDEPFEIEGLAVGLIRNTMIM